MINRLPRKLLLIIVSCLVVSTLTVTSAVSAAAATTSTTSHTTTAPTPHPIVKSVSPKTGRQNQTLKVSIYGENFTNATGVSFGTDIKVTDIVVSSNTVITANITIGNHAAVGARVVTVTTPSGNGELKSGFTVTKNEPVVKSVSPGKGKQAQTLKVTISGSNFIGTTVVSFGAGIKINSFSVTSDTTMTVSITIATRATVGSRSISVSNPSGTGTLKNGFTVIKS
jgi:hypothetical protein